MPCIYHIISNLDTKICTSCHLPIHFRRTD